MRTRSIAVALVVLVLAGCAVSEPATPRVSTSTPSTKDSFTVVIRRTGGIAGVDETLVVEPDGQWRRTGRGGAPGSGRLTDAALANLSALTADGRLAAEARRATTPTICSDAFIYRLEVDRLTVNYVDCPDDPDRPVAAIAIVDFLNREAPG